MLSRFMGSLTKLSESPLKDIEDKKGQMDMGTLCYRLYNGARLDGASRYESYLVVKAFFAGSADAHNQAEEGGEEQ